jgi:Beta-propeller repeat
VTGFSSSTGSIAVDSAGNAYVTGGTYSTNFPGAGSSLIQSASDGLEDAFVVKFRTTGALVYSTPWEAPAMMRAVALLWTLPETRMWPDP